MLDLVISRKHGLNSGANIRKYVVRTVGQGVYYAVIYEK
jgi:hypothetical protein